MSLWVVRKKKNQGTSSALGRPNTTIRWGIAGVGRIAHEFAVGLTVGGHEHTVSTTKEAD